MDQAQTLATVWEMGVSYTTSFTLRTVILLGIPEIFSQSNKSMSLEEIAKELPGTNVQIPHLGRLLDHLVVKKFLKKIHALDDEDVPKYEPTEFMDLLTPSRFAAIQLVQNEILMSGWPHLCEFILHGGKSPFERARGMSLWDYFAVNPEVTKIFSNAMVALSNLTMDSVIENYPGFASIQGVLVDVGGAFGIDINKIITKYPHIQGVNLELPPVVEIAPQLPGVKNIAGDMFRSVPKANAILLKYMLHDFEDEPSVAILRNCYDALPEGGKVIIVDLIMDPAEKGPFESLKFSVDLILMVLTNGGRERTQVQWIELLQQANFQDIKLMTYPTCFPAVIEARK